MTALAILASDPVRLLALAALAAPFVVSALIKLRDPARAEAEVAQMGLRPAREVVRAVVAVQLGGAVLLFVPGLAWVGAGLLAGFTLMATMLAHPWWRDPAQVMPFWEHAAIAGGLLMVAVLAARGG